MQKSTFELIYDVSVNLDKGQDIIDKLQTSQFQSRLAQYFKTI